MTRHDSLLLKAAEALSHGADPFSSGFLTENNVTLDECMALSERIAILCKGWLASGKDDRLKILALGAVYGEDGIGIDAFRASIEHHQTFEKTMKRLKELK